MGRILVGEKKSTTVSDRKIRYEHFIWRFFNPPLNFQYTIFTCWKGFQFGQNHCFQASPPSQIWFGGSDINFISAVGKGVLKLLYATGIRFKKCWFILRKKSKNREMWKWISLAFRLRNIFVFQQRKCENRIDKLYFVLDLGLFLTFWSYTLREEVIVNMLFFVFFMDVCIFMADTLPGK